MKRGRLVALSAIVVVSALLALGFESLDELAGASQFESFLLDYRQTTTAESFQEGIGDRESQIVLVLFDEYSVMDSVDGWDWISPYPREPLADLIDALAGAGARTIGLDVYLDRLYPRLEGDRRLREAMARAGNVVLVSPLATTDSGSVSMPPHPYFAEVAAGVGTAELPSSYDVYRLGALAARSGDHLVPSFALALFAHARGLDVDSLLAAAVARGRIELPGLPPQVGRVDATWFRESAARAQPLVPFHIRFVGPPSSADATDQAGTFTAVTSYSVPLLAALDPDRFRDKIVLLGTGFHGEDRFRTPFQDFVPPADSALPDPKPYGWTYGVEIHANALQNMLDGEYVRPLGGLAKAVLLLLVAAITGAAAFRLGAWLGAAALALTALGIAVYAAWAWAGSVYLSGMELVHLDARFLWVPMTPLLMGAVISYVGSVGYVSIVEGREKRFIKGAFAKYVSEDIVEEISNNPAALQLGGAKRPLSLLFSDLAGFTTISESMEPEEVIAILNEYLDEMTQVVLDQGGYLDKYIGDAIMAFWNMPKPLEDHPDRAMRTAILMQRGMASLNRRWSERDPDHLQLSVRIGVHSGEVVVGNVGGQSNFDYTAIGDAVNLAARLEPANKDYGTLTMVSEATLAASRGYYRVRELDTIAVVGKAAPVKVYELLEEGGAELAPEKERALELYAKGMAAYKRHDWEGAKSLFEAALAACPEDEPSRLYVKRCAEHIVSPPPAGWDFVVRRTKK